jgi:hypothetical protein
MHMRLHHLPKMGLALLTAVVLAIAGIAPTRAIASPAQHASGMVTEGTKVTLHETSIAGPGFAGTAIAWTGTDPAHHLNIKSGTDGLHFPTKTTLPETSPFAPAVTNLPSEGSVVLVLLAWTGTDATHHLNVQCTTQFPQFPDPAHTKTLLSETALGAPGFISNEIAWTGTDVAHLLNVAQLQGL